MTVEPLRYGHMLQEYYVSRVRAILAERRQLRAQVRTPAQLAALQRSVRRKVRQCFGPFPARTPLNARVTGVVERRDYVIEKVIYESRPGLPVTANLYLPRSGRPSFPAVLGACGHSANGKADPQYQAFCQNFARQGYVVLIYDPVAQGERAQYSARERDFRPEDCCVDHNVLGRQLHLTGEFFGTRCVWDGMRGLDYLLSRSEVDRRRVGVTGNSGGGTMATYLFALDGRISMAAPDCFVTSYRCNLENELPADAEQIPPGILAQGLDMADFFVARIPQPAILLGQVNDFFDRRGLEAAYEELRRLYAILGAEKSIQLHVGAGHHGYHRDSREAAYRFFHRHAGVKRTSMEPDSETPEKEETLWAAPRGQVANLRPRRAFDLVRERATGIAARRPKATGERLLNLLREHLRLPARATPHYRVLRGPCLDLRTLRCRSRFAVETEPGIQVILHTMAPWKFINQLPERRPIRLTLPHIASAESVSITEAGDREWKFWLDVRGMGETRALCVDHLSDDFFDEFGPDYFHAAYGLMLNEPLCGRRVHDILSVLDLFAAKRCPSVHLMGEGMGAITATLGACLHPLVRRVTLRHAPRSWQEWTQLPFPEWPLSSSLYGVLKDFDLPDCYRFLGRRLRVESWWDARMAPPRHSAHKTP